MKFSKSNPFVESLGFELLKVDAGEAEIAITLRPDQLNSWQVGHGGVTMTLLDVVMAQAARSPMPGQPKDERGVVTIEMKTSFLRPGQKRLIARGKLLHRTSSMAFCEASVLHENGELVAHATGTFKYLRGLPAGKRLIKRAGASD
ncbi:MAG: PaaI family thioesterase [Ideonella sp.]